MTQRRAFAAVSAALAIAIALCAAPAGRACPFCNAALQTLSEEISGSEIAVIAELVEPAPQADADPAASVVPPEAMPGAKFRVVEAIHSAEKLDGAKEIEVIYFGNDPPTKKFLVTAILVDGKREWTTPIPLSDRGVEYVKKLPGLPTGVERIAFFQEHLEDDDPLLAQDAYDEFSRAPYADVKALGPRMHRDKLLKWIDDPDVGPAGRRLYLTMLGVCAKPEDLALLEEMLSYDYQAMKPAIAMAVSTTAATAPGAGAGLLDEVLHAEERRKKESLDALVACYLKLTGPAGLELVNERFLNNPNVEYKYLHATIMALRFHGEESDEIPRSELLKSLRLALNHADFADQVIPDLTRWEDWDSMPRLVEMFKESASDGWIRQPVASYLLIAEEQPGEASERARAAIAELESLDPETIERARNLQAFSLLPMSAGPQTKPAGAGASASAEPVDPKVAAASPESQSSTADAQAPAPGPAPTPAVPPAAAPPIPPNRLKIIGVPLIAVLVLVAILAVLLRGADPRSSSEP